MRCRPVQKLRLRLAHSTARNSAAAPQRSTRPGLDRSGALVAAVVGMGTAAVVVVALAADVEIEVLVGRGLQSSPETKLTRARYRFPVTGNVIHV